MSNGARPIFDRKLLEVRRKRAQRMAVPGAGFLIERAAEEICDRLAVTNRKFLSAVDVLSPSLLLRESVARTCPGIAIHAVDTLQDDGGLGLAEASFDLAFSGFGLHWVDDLPGALAQIRRALKPDGLFMAVLPADGTLAELREAAIAAEMATSGGAAMRVDPFADVRSLGALLQRAGFALPVADVERLDLRYRHVRSLVRDLRGMGAASALAERAPALKPDFPEALDREYRERFDAGSGKIAATFNLVFLTGWTPHPSQQKPLKPGSAIQKLTDALRR